MWHYVFINNAQEVKNVLVFDSHDADITEHKRAQEDLFGEELHVVIEDPDAVVGPTRTSYQGWEFRLPRPYASWLYDEVMGEWRAPIPHPLALDDNWDSEFPGDYIWDESVQNWVLTP
jgi:hypothetical protein